MEEATPTTSEAPGWRRWLPWGLVGVATLWCLIAYLPEVTGGAPALNDHVYHLGLIQRVQDAWEAGGNPRDAWIPYWGQGFSVLRYYQHLPHLGVVWLYRLMQGTVELRDVFLAVHLLAMVLAPLCFFWGGRLLGLPRLAAALIALCVPLLGVDPNLPYGLGLQPRSFLWSGGGQFAQEVGLLFFPLALGMLHRSVLRGRAYGGALALLSLTWLSHLLLGYTACLLGCLVLLRPEARGQRRWVLVRLTGLYAATFAVVSYLLLPSLLETGLLSHSTWEAPAYWDSLGAGTVLEALVTGRLLDGPREPILTILALLGMVLGFRSLWRRRAASGAVRFALLAMILGLLLYFGRATWGKALELLPFSGSLPFHRFICAVQYAGLLLTGIALAALWRLLRWHQSPGCAAVALLLTMALLSSAAVSSWGTASDSARWQAEAVAQARPRRDDLDALLSRFRALDHERSGRGYGGTSWDGGQRFRVAGAPVYTAWTGADLPALSYMFHTMSRNSDLEVYFARQRRDHYDLFNVRYLLAPRASDLPPFAQILEKRPGLVAAIVATRGYLDLVRVRGTVDAVGAGPVALRELGRRFVESDWHGRGLTVRVRWRRNEPRPADALPVTTRFPRAPAEREAPPGAILRQWGRHDRFGAQVVVREAAHLLLRATYHPGWQARVDGRPTPTVMLAPSLLGVPLAPGAHRVELAYVSSAWTRALFWLGLGVLGLAFLADRLRLWPSAKAVPRPGTRRLALEIAVVAVVFLAGWLLTW